MNRSITHLLFDLGGVIIKLRGTPIALEWFAKPLTLEEVWKIWLTSDAPRLFESGTIGPDEFSQQVVDELNLRVGPEEFLAHFTLLPEGVYAGAHDLLATAKQHYTTACFSNSNVLHWPRKLYEMKLDVAFDHHFASHLMGMVKPDPEAFDFVSRQMDVAARHIFFFDDNQLNVDAALNAGMHARRVVGVEEFAQALRELPRWG